MTTEKTDSIPDWIRRAVARNPEYTAWGPGCDYMRSVGDPASYEAAGEYGSWVDFLAAYDMPNMMNECVNFYFDAQGCEEDGDGKLVRLEGCGPLRLDLVLWIIHPRKGASKGVRVRDLQRTDVPRALTWLRAAAARNAERFGKLGAL